MVAASRRNPCRLDCCFDSRDGWELHIARQRAIFQRLRQRFILMPTDQGQPPLTQDFELSDYLLECSTLQVRAALRLGSKAWLRVGLALVLACELTLVLGPDVSQAVLVLAGWLVYAQACLVEQHYVWLVEQLTPLHDVANARAELASLRTPSLFWRPAYLWLHEWGKRTRQRAGIVTRVRSACMAASDSYREERTLRSLAAQGFTALGESPMGAAGELGRGSGGGGGGGGGDGGGGVGVGGGGGGGGTGGVAGGGTGGRTADNEAGEEVNQRRSELASLTSAPHAEGEAGRAAAAAAAAACVAVAGGVSLSALRSAEGVAADKEARRAELVQLQMQRLHPGEVTRVPPPGSDGSHRPGLDRFLARLSQQDETTDLAVMKRMAERPAQRWLQCMLLFGAVHATLSLVLCTPRGWWDVSIAIGILPVLIALVFKDRCTHTPAPACAPFPATATATAPCHRHSHYPLAPVPPPSSPRTSWPRYGRPTGMATPGAGALRAAADGALALPRGPRRQAHGAGGLPAGAAAQVRPSGQAAAECAGALAPREKERATPVTATPRRRAHAPERPQMHYALIMRLRPAYPTPRPDPRGAGAGAPTRREARRRAG